MTSDHDPVLDVLLKVLPISWTRFQVLAGSSGRVLSSQGLDSSMHATVVPLNHEHVLADAAIYQLNGR